MKSTEDDAAHPDGSQSSLVFDMFFKTWGPRGHGLVEPGNMSCVFSSVDGDYGLRSHTVGVKRRHTINSKKLSSIFQRGNVAISRFVAFT